MNNKNLTVARDYFFQGINFLDKNDYINAEIKFKESLIIEPNRISTLNNLVTSQIALTKYQDALATVNNILKIDSKNSYGLFQKGKIYEILKDYRNAIKYYELSIKFDENFILSYINLARLYEEKKETEMASKYYLSGIMIEPHNSIINFNYGNFLLKNKMYELSIKSYNKALQIDPSYFEAYCNKGIALEYLEKYDEAILNYKKSLHINQNFSDAYLNLGNTYEKINDFENSLKCYNNAIELDKLNAITHTNRGALFLKNKKIFDALKDFDTAILIDNKYWEAYLNKSFILLLHGKYEEGFILYESRIKVIEQPNILHNFGKKLDNLHQLKENSKLLIICEQGLGDTIQFIRYLHELNKLSNNIYIKIQKELVQLFKNEKFIIYDDESNVDIVFDYYSLLMSLPKIFNTKLENIPSNSNYIYPNEFKIKQWKCIIKRNSFNNKLNIGINWKGNPKHTNDKNRSILLNKFLKYLPNIHNYYVLQKDLNRIETLDIENCGLNIENYNSKIIDFSDTAAFCLNLDLIVTVDTSIAHLSGALGIKTWVLVTYSPDWRWMLEGDSSPWYKSIKLIRQTKNGNWENTLQKIKNDLINL